jgi:hypothetical protein
MVTTTLKLNKIGIIKTKIKEDIGSEERYTSFSQHAPEGPRNRL